MTPEQAIEFAMLLKKEYFDKIEKKEKDHMNKHTPGPWKIMKSNSALSIVLDNDKFSIGIATIKTKNSKEEKISNALLISAAPDLLKALKNLVERCDGSEGVQADGSNMCTLEAHAAIKKAEGL